MMREKLFTKKELKERMFGDEKIVHFEYNKKYKTFTMVTNDNGCFTRYTFENEIEKDKNGCEYIPSYYQVFGLELFESTKIYLNTDR